MVLTTEHLRSHVARSSTGISTVVGTVGPSNTKVSDMSKPFAIQDNILRLDITMNNSLVMEVFQTQKNANNQEL